MSVRTRRCIAFVFAQALFLAPAYAAGAARCEAPVLKYLAAAQMRAQLAGQPRTTEQEFVAARDQMLGRVDAAIARVQQSKFTDQVLRARALKQLRRASKDVQRRAGNYVKKLSDAAVAQALAVVREHGRYRRCLAQHKNGRAALQACVAIDLRTKLAAAEQRVASASRATMLADLQQARTRLTALTYDGGDYDEYFEFSWYVFTSDDALMWALWPPLLVADVLLSPIVFAYKMAHWLFLD